MRRLACHVVQMVFAACSMALFSKFSSRIPASVYVARLPHYIDERFATREAIEAAATRASLYREPAEGLAAGGTLDTRMELCAVCQGDCAPCKGVRAQLSRWSPP